MEQKHILYFELFDALNNTQCPICLIVVKRIEKYFENLIYENINDVNFRKKFREAGGFCNLHSYKFMRYNDGLAIALTHRILIKDLVSEIKHIASKRRPSKASNRCAICQYQQELEQRFTAGLMNHWNDEQLQQKFQVSAGLCVPHFRKLLHQTRKPPEWLLRTQLEYYKNLLTQLDKFIDSCNACLGNNRPLLNEEEKLVWQKVISVLYGFEGRVEQ